MQKSKESTDISPDQNTAKNVEGILDFNALQYECYPDMTVVVDRCYKDSFFQKNSYTANETGYCILNSGSDYINSRTSYLTFEVKTVGNSPIKPLWGNRCDSAYNFIRSLRITDRAGNEIEYITHANILANLRVHLENGRNTVANIRSQCAGKSFIDTVDTIAYDQDKIRYVLPLRWMSGLFNYDNLLPAQLCSGLRIQIVWERDERVAYWPNEPDLALAGYVIENPRIVLDSHKLADSVARELNTRSANDGLEIQFRTFFTGEHSITASSKANLEIRRAVSRAFTCLLHHKTRPANEYNDRSMQTSKLDFLEYQWRAGNLYFPQQIAKADKPEDLAPELLTKIYQLYGKLETPLDACDVVLEDIVNDYNTDPPPQQTLWEFAAGGTLAFHPDNRFAWAGNADAAGADTGTLTYDQNGANGLTPAQARALFQVGDRLEIFRNAPESAQIATIIDVSIADPLVLTVEGNRFALLAPGNITSAEFIRHRLRAPAAQGQYGYGGLSVIPVNLERSSVQDISGMPLNNSRVLAFNGKLNAPKDKDFLMFLQYLKIARVFMNNTELEE